MREETAARHSFQQVCVDTSSEMRGISCLFLVLAIVLQLSDSIPTAIPTIIPTIIPTTKPSIAPTIIPTRNPSHTPTKRPISPPTASPTAIPSVQPTSMPTVTIKPSPFPSSQPSSRPTRQPSADPTGQPSSGPSSQPTGQPSFAPTSPTGQPTSAPNHPSSQPSSQPSASPSYSHKPTIAPTRKPSARPTCIPTARPTANPTTVAPSMPTSQPSRQPTRQPSRQPSGRPSSQPSSSPSNPTSQPSSSPSKQPTSQPTTWPTSQPSSRPSKEPRLRPTPLPTTATPIGDPTSQPSAAPTNQPSSRPTAEPTVTKRPSSYPTGQPSCGPTGQPSSMPSKAPSGQPTSQPSRPTSQPSGTPTNQPSAQPSRRPSSQPSSRPSIQPSSQPSSQPTSPTGQPSSTPSRVPTARPSPSPTVSFRPTSQPSGQPSSVPSEQPQGSPTSVPTRTFRPTSRPSGVPTGGPTSRPSFEGGFGFTERPTAFFETIDVSGTVQFQPDAEAACNPVQIQVSFAFTKNLTAGSTVVIAAPGVTSGACYNISGGFDISNIYIANEARFTVSFFEGTYLDNFGGSYFSLYLNSGVNPAATYTLFVDRANKLRRSCSLEASWAVTVYPNNGRISGTVGSISVIEAYPKRCFVFTSDVYFQNAAPQFYAGINATLRLGYEVTAGTVITLHLPGFTNSVGAYPLNVLTENSSRWEAVRAGFDTHLINITSSTNFTWSGRWIEGNPANNFRDSKVLLTAYGYQAFNDLFWVTVPKSHNHIIPICGHPANDETIRISTRSDYFYSNSTPVQTTNVIGSGCTGLNQCSGYGTCDYCTATCTCDEGHGSARDRRRSIAQDFLPDCSSKTCPVGPSVGSVGIFSYADIDGDYTDGKFMHRLMECSNNGICNRKTGLCQCAKGFYGAACQKMQCGGSPVCSGRGRCLPMRRLARDSEALPLSTRSKGYISLNESRDNSWDKDFGHACVCDSSWPVGLGSGQTQLAEFFGTTCEMRRCPSGDDPNTRQVDETDCEGKAQTGDGSREFGRAGNKCHVDCSNRGICNHHTGVCGCFPGFTGDNCGTYV